MQTIEEEIASLKQTYAANEQRNRTMEEKLFRNMQKVQLLTEHNGIHIETINALKKKKQLESCFQMIDESK